MIIDTEKLIETLRRSQKCVISTAIDTSAGLTDAVKLKLTELDKKIADVKYFELFAGNILPKKPATQVDKDFEAALSYVDEIERLSNKIRTTILGPGGK